MNTKNPYREPMYPPKGYVGSARDDDGGDDDDNNNNNHDDDNDDEQEYKYYPPVFASPILTDKHKLTQRQKQIDMGKNTIGYQNYIKTVPRYARQRYNPIHPMTPDIYDATASKRGFDGRVRAWRRRLHQWDIMPGQPLPLDPKPFVPHRNATKSAEKRQKATLKPIDEPDSISVNRGGGKGLFDDFDL